MPEKPAAERTEQPTPKKLEKARKKGQVPHSEELTSVITLLALIGIMALTGPSLLRWSITQVRQGIFCENIVFADSISFWNYTKAKIADSIIVICPILAALFAGSVLACVAVGGLNFAPAAVGLRFSHINPVTGFSKLINGRSMVKLLISILKLVFVSFIVGFS